VIYRRNVAQRAAPLRTSPQRNVFNFHTGGQMSKPSFEVSADVEKCYDYLKPRQEATYRELSQFLGRDIKGRDRYVLESARRKLERIGIVFVIETGVGLKRANHAQVAALSTDMPIKKIRRAIKRAGKREKIVDVQLSEDDRAAFYIGRAVLGAVSQSVRRAAARFVVWVGRDRGARRRLAGASRPATTEQAPFIMFGLLCVSWFQPPAIPADALRSLFRPGAFCTARFRSR
jgi:hypothetical protein